EAGERDRRAHQLQELAAAERIEPFGGASWKLAMEQLAEFLALGELFEAAPVFGALPAGQPLADRFEVHSFSHASRPSTMTRRAPHAFVHVDAVIEVDEFRKVVHPRPLQWPAGLEALAHGLEHRALGPDLRMAVHAGLGRRDPGEGRGFDRGVAVTAIEAFAAHVVLVAEGDRLLARGVRQGPVRGAAHDVDQPAQPRDEEHRSEDAHPRDGVRAAMEYLRHSARLYPSTGSLLADAKDG